MNRSSETLLTEADWQRLPHRPRPWLLADGARIEAIKGFSDSVSHQLRALLLNDAENKLAEGEIVYPPTGFLMEPVRAVQGRILTLALSYRLTGDRRFFLRARDELLRLASLPEWRPGHFLDVGEAALAAGIGLDWLYSELAPEEREQVAQAIVHNALLPSLDVPEGGNSWVNGDFNWNQVCHGGLVVGALAVAECEPTLARRIIERALRNLPTAAAVYAPDGSYPEGPSYWSYGTTFHVILLEALRSAFGTSCGLENAPGFLQSADFMAQMVAPTGQDFNFSDYHRRNPSEPVLLWFARERGQRDPAREELINLDRMYRVLGEIRQDNARCELPLSRHLALGLLWWQPNLPSLPVVPNLPLHWTATGTLPIAVLRSAWNDPEATYLAIKGGTPDQSHGHMDIGSFVFEADGVRWAVDLGTEDYDRMRAAKLDLWNSGQNSSRWTTFRVGPEGHNLLRFDGAFQEVSGKAEIRSLPAVNGVVGNVVDLTSVYHGQVARAERTVRLYPDRSASFTDEWITGDHPVNASTQWLTTAAVTRTGKGVRLEQAGRILDIEVSGGPAVTVEIGDVSSARGPQDSPNAGMTRLLFCVPTAAQSRGAITLKAIPGGTLFRAGAVPEALSEN